MDNVSKKKKRIKWTTFLLLLCLGYVIYMVVDQERQLAVSRREAENLRAREATLKAENERLHQEQQLLQTDAYIERVAREELGLVKPGEIPYLVGQQQTPPKSP